MKTNILMLSLLASVACASSAYANTDNADDFRNDPRDYLTKKFVPSTMFEISFKKDDIQYLSRFDLDRENEAHNLGYTEKTYISGQEKVGDKFLPVTSSSLEGFDYTVSKKWLESGKYHVLFHFIGKPEMTTKEINGINVSKITKQDKVVGSFDIDLKEGKKECVLAKTESTPNDSRSVELCITPLD